MENAERHDNYGGPDKRFTAAQRRRLKHKLNSRKTHSHAGLLVVVQEDGTVRRHPCERCNPPAKQVRTVGGVRVA